MKKSFAFLSILSILFFYSPFHVAATSVAFDSESEIDQQICNTTKSYNHTSTGSNLIDVVVVVDDTHNGADNIHHITGVTDNGTSMTLSVIELGDGVNAAEPLYIFTLLNPTTGTKSITVTCDSNTTINSAALSYTGSGGVDNTGLNYSTSKPVTGTVNVLTANSWVIGSCSEGNTGFPTLSTGFVSTRTTMTFEAVSGDTNGTVSTGNYNMSCTVAGTTPRLSIAMVSIKPFVASVVKNPSTITFFGWW